MSNGLAIAVATRGLTTKISESLASSALPGLGARVSAARPNTLTATEACVNAFLYQVTPNAALRNVDLPTRRVGGELIQRPQLALDLHYLLTFTGDESDLTPQRLMGVVLPALHAEPTLTRGEVDRLVRAQIPGLLDDADLAQQVELVRFGLGTMNLEELSKLWSVFFQTQYLLSVPVQASVVLLEAPLNPSPAQLVRNRAVYSGLPEQPVLRNMNPSFAALNTDGLPNLLVLNGSGLSGERTRVQFGAQEPGDALTVSTFQVTSELPVGLRAGVHAVRVLVAHEFEQQGDFQEFELQSNSLAFALAPRIVSESPLVVTTGALRLEVLPSVARSQRVRVILQRLVPSIQRVALTWVPPVVPAGEETPADYTALEVELPALEPGRYHVWIEVDGVLSGLGAATEEAPFVELV